MPSQVADDQFPPGVCRTCYNGHFDFTFVQYDELCIFCVLALLAEKCTDSDVSLLLLRRLSQLPAQDLEFVMPQLAHMALTYPNTVAVQMGDLLVTRCAHFMHFALKLTWWLQAAASYLDIQALERSEPLIHRIEISVVNSESDTQLFLSPIEIQELHQRQSSLTSSQSSSSQSSSSILSQSHSTSPISLYTSPTQIQTPQTPTPTTTITTTTPDFTAAFITKKTRSEFFTAQLQLYRLFNSISTQLTPLSRSRRKLLLPYCLQQLRCRGLYFPVFSSLDEHFIVHQLYPEQGIVLNSRDKAPFLVWAKVEFTDKPLFDENIYEPIIPLIEAKERAEMEESLQQSSKHQNTNHSVTTTTTSTLSDSEDSAATAAAAAANITKPAVSSIDNDIHHGLQTLSLTATTTTTSSAQHEQQQQQQPSLSPPVSPKSEQLSPAHELVTNNNNNHSSQTSISNQSQQQQQPTGSNSNSNPVIIDPSKSSSITTGTTTTTTSPPSTTNPNTPPLTMYDPFGETYDQRCERLLTENDAVDETDDTTTTGSRSRSISHVPSSGGGGDISLLSVIFKGGDDCRQEVIAMQLINLFHEIFTTASLPLQLRPYGVLVTSHNSGMIETIVNSASIDGIKKGLPRGLTFPAWFQQYFTSLGCYPTAVNNFVESMAAYSIVCYFLQIKDRHNGNIMLDNQGLIMHIDFGFILSSSPGNNMNFENVPFKLTREYVQIMGGETGIPYERFKALFIRGFIEVRKHFHKFIILADIMQNANIVAFKAGGKYTIQQFRQRFVPEKNDTEAIEYAASLVDISCNHWRSSQYDEYQKITNGIL